MNGNGSQHLDDDEINMEVNTDDDDDEEFITPNKVGLSFSLTTKLCSNQFSIV